MKISNIDVLKAMQNVGLMALNIHKEVKSGLTVQVFVKNLYDHELCEIRVVIWSIPELSSNVLYPIRVLNR